MRALSRAAPPPDPHPPLAPPPAAAPQGKGEGEGERARSHDATLRDDSSLGRQVIGTWRGWAATRSIQARTAG